MRNPFNFEAESFELDTEFDEYEEEQLGDELEFDESLFSPELEEEEFRVSDLPNKVREAFGMGPLAWPLVVQRAIEAGIGDSAKLANIVFFLHHPERGGRALNPSETNFKKFSEEWKAWRTLIEPMLKKTSGVPAPPTSGTTIGPKPTTDPPPPVEGPLRGITGTACPSGRGKCWPERGKSRDIIDADTPWNGKSNRSATNYEAVLDYFNVGNSRDRVPENPRYRRIPNGSTWCNIYVHDVTRAMWASIPHWVCKSRYPNCDPRNTKQWTELNANATVDWLLSKGRNHGWIQVDSNLCSWIHNQVQTGTMIPAVDPAITNNLRNAAWRIARTAHSNPSLLLQPSYIAQKLSNQGLPTVAMLKNPGGIGHVAMVRPERDNLHGEVQKNGKFLPRTAQAGASNWSNQLMHNMARAMYAGRVLFFVHE